MKYIKNFKLFESVEEPIIYKEEDGNFFKQSLNGEWVECSEKEFKYNKYVEILRKKGITPNSKHHNYDYLYKSIIKAMEEVDNQKK